MAVQKLVVVGAQRSRSAPAASGGARGRELRPRVRLRTASFPARLRQHTRRSLDKGVEVPFRPSARARARQGLLPGQPPRGKMGSVRTGGRIRKQSARLAGRASLDAGARSAVQGRHGPQSRRRALLGAEGAQVRESGTPRWVWGGRSEGGGVEVSCFTAGSDDAAASRSSQCRPKIATP